jgi:hypothetical protein
MTQEFYALGSNRCAKAVRSFLDHFLPNREPCCSDYPLPENSDTPKTILKTESEILDYMENHPEEPYGLYWDDAGTSYTQVMLFYTRDSKVIFGLAEDTVDQARKLKELADFVGAKYSMYGSEQRPPDTSCEFIILCEAQNKKAECSQKKRRGGRSERAD